MKFHGASFDIKIRPTPHSPLVACRVLGKMQADGSFSVTVETPDVRFTELLTRQFSELFGEWFTWDPRMQEVTETETQTDLTKENHNGKGYARNPGSRSRILEAGTPQVDKPDQPDQGPTGSPGTGESPGGPVPVVDPDPRG